MRQFVHTAGVVEPQLVTGVADEYIPGAVFGGSGVQDGTDAGPRGEPAGNVPGPQDGVDPLQPCAHDDDPLSNVESRPMIESGCVRGSSEPDEE
jgi:hypothetical protein